MSIQKYKGFHSALKLIKEEPKETFQHPSFVKQCFVTLFEVVAYLIEEKIKESEG